MRRLGGCYKLSKDNNTECPLTTLQQIIVTRPAASSLAQGIDTCPSYVWRKQKVFLSMREPGSRRSQRIGFLDIIDRHPDPPGHTHFGYAGTLINPSIRSRDRIPAGTFSCSRASGQQSEPVDPQNRAHSCKSIMLACILICSPNIDSNSKSRSCRGTHHPAQT
jgi:hypothetical protein